MTIKCPKCDSENKDTARFCSNCAAPLKRVEEAVHTQTLETHTERLTRGTVFAERYEIIEKLGKGGMGRVYRVEDTKLNQEVALKLIKSEIAKDKKIIERFKNELKTARMIAHKNVCRMFDLGEEDGVHFITMEYVSGEDLKSFLRRSGQLAVGTAVRIAKNICEGLSEAHKFGVVHRDLKPNNIMIDREGNARIMDFGIARSLEAKGITGAGVMIGTPEYMSPEQVEGKTIDQRSDIYSFGVILYEMMTGQLPFTGETNLSIAVKHKTEKPVPPNELNNQLSEELNQLILKCLEKEKKNRYQNVNEILSFFSQYLTSGTATDISPSRSKVTSDKFTASEWEHSLAVLPFANLSPEKEQEYFCDGLTEELINALSNIKNLRVVARTSAFAFKGKEKEVREIGEQLHVDKILEGSVRQVGKRLRIMAQLIDVKDDCHIWSERFDREMKDVFEIQDEVTLAIVDKLRIKLLGDEKQRLLARPTENQKAYELFLKGRFFWFKRNEEGFRKAFDYYKQAIEIDPCYALAYCGISDAYCQMGNWGLRRPKEIIPLAKAAAQKALELDDSLSETHASMALFQSCFEWDLNSAEKEYKKAINLNPNNTMAHMWYGLYCLSAKARLDDAIFEIKLAYKLDPLSPIINWSIGFILYLSRDYDEAIQAFEKTLEIESNFQPALQYYILTYLQKKKYDESMIHYLLEFFPDMPKEPILEAYRKTGFKPAVEKFYEILLAVPDNVRPNEWVLAYFCAWLDRKDEAFEWLEKAFEEKYNSMFWLPLDPIFDNLHSDKRFHDLVNKIGLE